ncbi:hypothetical protein PHYBOEH_010351 [Phytophthora boehmeriae]|uniref:Uncharacterized protein n=1 Tax=Phytophthora boehmeriae TaxID=109152 RepID=A0A8T1WY56_9STRA|nr:hypothetical protein PHYBOEH_010351 [Phytophthora boehmeriae]
MALIERLLTAVYAREPHVKVVAAVTGGGVSVTERLFRPGSSSTMLHFAVPYSRASLESFLSSSTPSSVRLKFCSAETSERMALAAWNQAEEITRQEAQEDDVQAAAALPNALKRFRASLAIRIVDKKYYDMDEHKMVLALDRIARNGCCFVVAGRFDSKTDKRFISAEEVLEHHVPAVFRQLFIPLPETVFRNDISSTEIRQQMATT